MQKRSRQAERLGEIERREERVGEVEEVAF